MEVEKRRSTLEQPRTAEVRAFLICDIRGYSTFTSQRGDEAAAHLAMTFAGLAGDAVVARGGRVLGLRGDEAFAAFTSARQAVKAGLEIDLACTEESAAHPDFPIPVGIGIDFGEAVPVEDGYRGAAINMAARLCSKAVAGQVLVTRNVVDAAGELEGITFEDRGTAVVKGFGEPVATYEPVGTALPDQREAGREGRAPGGARGFLPIELDEPLPVVGRDAEMAWLRGTWRQARRGCGRVILVTGPAGIGKTRLAAAFASVVYADGGSVRYAGAGGAASAETISAIREACVTSLPGLWVLDDLGIYRESVASLSASLHEIESGPALVLSLLRDVGGDPAVARLIEAVDVNDDGRRELAPLDEHGVRAIARSYVIDVDDLPAEQILRASGGVPSRVHELVVDWSRDEAARRLAVAAKWLEAGRSRQAEGLRFADNMIALKLRRIYDTATREQLAGVCPYKGLGTFEESDAAYFFGREQLVGELAARSVGFGLLGVVGPSGSGKSSLVLAGLLPSLAAGLLPGSERWGRAVLRPGARPAAELDSALSGAERTFNLALASTDVFTPGIAFSHDGTELAACCTSPSAVEVMNVASGRRLFTAHIAGEAHSLAYSPTAPELAIGSSNGRIYLWNTQRGTQTAAITAAASNVVSVAYSTDGKLLAAGLRDGTSVLLDRATGETLGQPFPAELGALPTLLFSSNGQLVINYTGTATIWPTDLAALQRYACQVAGRDITPGEWSNVLPGQPYQHLCPSLSSTASR